jgi:hypothetical protein
VQAFDLLRAQRYGRIAPAEADIGMMAFGLGELANLLYECERLAEVPEMEGPLDAAAVIQQCLRASALPEDLKDRAL